MVKCPNDGLLQANDGKMHVNDDEVLVNDGEMSEWSYTILISSSLTSISPSLTSILTSLAWSKPPFGHLTIIEKLHRMLYVYFSTPKKFMIQPKETKRDQDWSWTFLWPRFTSFYNTGSFIEYIKRPFYLVYNCIIASFESTCSAIVQLI